MLICHLSSVICHFVMQRIAIGKIAKPVGLKGEVKVLPLTKNTGIFAAPGVVYINGAAFGVTKARVTGDFAYLFFDGVNDCTAAEKLRGAELQIERGKVKQPDEGEYFVSDLIGSKVVADGEELGTLTDILQHGAADVFVVRGADNKDVMFPHLVSVVVGVDLGSKIIMLDKKEFEKVAVKN